MDTTRKKYNPSQKKLAIYIGYGDKGQARIDFIHQKIKESNSSLSALFVQFLRHKFPDFPV